MILTQGVASSDKWPCVAYSLNIKKGETFYFSDNVCLDLFMDAAKNTHLIE